jgi:hypothetical protein
MAVGRGDRDPVRSPLSAGQLGRLTPAEGKKICELYARGLSIPVLMARFAAGETAIRHALAKKSP